MFSFQGTLDISINMETLNVQVRDAIHYVVDVLIGINVKIGIK